MDQSKIQEAKNDILRSKFYIKNPIFKANPKLFENLAEILALFGNTVFLDDTNDHKVINFILGIY